MSRRDTVLIEHRAAVRQAAEANKAETISLFGSVARGEDTETSDIDFLVRFRKDASTFDLGALMWDLEEILGEKVDIVSDGKQFRSGNCQRILREAIPL